MIYFFFRLSSIAIWRHQTTEMFKIQLVNQWACHDDVFDMQHCNSRLVHCAHPPLRVTTSAPGLVCLSTRNARIVFHAVCQWITKKAKLEKMWELLWVRIFFFFGSATYPWDPNRSCHLFRCVQTCTDGKLQPGLHSNFLCVQPCTVKFRVCNLAQ